MKRDFGTVLIGFDGEPIIDSSPIDERGRKKEGPTNVTLAQVARAALLAQYPDEQNLSGDEKYARYKLVGRIDADVRAGVATELTPDELAKVRALIGKGYGASVVGPAFTVLDRDYVEPPPAVADAEPDVPVAHRPV